ncbi:hypothetical protein HIM_07499 [Hirsutella minnesotensis 3608]|uniref:Major facilitator superfamily (MFS) profile domain-containing protein n=1 Tax=Hirsutella minnesotensis 3608 TaxID=1043627 RepID=A0A0F7ZN46_9HYPO|nr:hypothetical protein HIM_07499 [Hirsutella minnesotensis 3608]
MGAVRDFLGRRSLKVDDGRRTPAARLTLRESIFPIALVTVLFFLWGFSYGLLDTLNKHFQNVLHIDRARSSGLQAAYFGYEPRLPDALAMTPTLTSMNRRLTVSRAYPLASVGHAAWILRHYGYRAAFIWGLSLYALGALLAIAALKAHSFGGFCACIFIIGNGLGSLETAANPFIAVCGPARHSELRINMSQAFNGVGSVVAPVFGSYLFFNFSDEHALDNVQWVYLSIAVFVLLLAAAFFLAHIPEVTDADMALQAQEANLETDDKPIWRQHRLLHAAFAQSPSPASSSTVGRFAGVALMRFVRPRLVLLAFLTCCIVFIGPAISAGGNAGVALLFVVLFFESICFPTILALGMRGLGRHTKRGSGYIVAGVIGGAVGPPLTGYVGDRHGDGVAMVVPLCFFVAAWSYAVCVNFVPGYYTVIDSFGQAGEVAHAEADVENPSSGSTEKVVESKSSPASHHLASLDLPRSNN